MKNNFILLLIVFAFSQNLSAQITIDQNDFANAGETVRVTTATYSPLISYSGTGANYTWNFAHLVWQSQYDDDYLNTLNTETTYAVTFPDLSFSPYRCNIARAAETPLTTLPVLSTVFTEGYNFYYKNSTFYRQRGLGMKVAGFPTPVPMTHADTLYHFPINYGDEDSSFSDYKVRVPDLGTYVHKQQRKNKVDGWGTITTPFGTFEALRIKTEIRGSDSLYIDTLNNGIKVENDIIREYKWFGKNQKVPLLQINTQAGLFGQIQGFEFVTKVIYRDSVRFRPTGIFEPALSTIQFSVYPNPGNGRFFITSLNTLSGATLLLTDISGRVLINQPVNNATEMLDASALARGVYLLTLQSKEGTATKRVVIE
jgi:hypothetical protein